MVHERLFDPSGPGNSCLGQEMITGPRNSLLDPEMFNLPIPVRFLLCFSAKKAHH